MLIFALIQFGVFVLFAPSLSASTIEVVFSTNITSVQIGEPFTARCELRNYDLDDTDFHMNFYQNNVYFCHYIVLYSHHLEWTGFFRNPNLNNTEIIPHDYERQFNRSLSVYEISIVPKTLQNHSYYCEIGYISMDHIHSSKVNISVHEPQPLVAFSSDVTRVQTEFPFTATCAIFNFDAKNRNYLVKFYNKRDGLLATYEIQASGQSLLSSETYPNVSVSSGKRMTFPTFDLQITENQDKEQVYWCALEDDSQSGKPTFESNYWPNGPIVEFHSKANQNGFDRIGNCSIDLFDANGKNFNVKFYSNFGPNAENLLATFTVKPNKIKVFSSQHVPHWTSITHGASISFPNYEIQVKLNSFFGHWWCVFGIGIEGQPDYRQYKSNQIAL